MFPSCSLTVPDTNVLFDWSHATTQLLCEMLLLWQKSAPLLPVASFQSLNPVIVNVVSGLLRPILEAPNQRQGKQKAASFCTEYSSQLYWLNHEGLNDLPL